MIVTEMKTAASFVACLLYAGVASAQTATASQPGDIIVTAQKRAEDIQKVGAAITAIGGPALEAARVRQAVDLSKVTPGLSTVNFTGDETPIFSIRGIGLDDFNPSNSSGTAIYIDGIYETSPVFLSAPLFDISRVEVLKGPQGTLYGRNATGGAISVISNQPSEHTSAEATLGFGRWNTVEARGYITGQLADGLTGRLAGTLTRQGYGFQQDVDTGRRFGRTRDFALRGLLKYQGSGFDTTLSVHGSRDYSTPSSYQNRFTAVPGCDECAALFDTGGDSSSRVKVGDLDLRRRETTLGTSLTTNIDLGFAKLVSILGYDHITRNNVDNNDGIPVAVYNFFQREKVSQFYEETRLISQTRVFGVTDWLIGTSYSSQKFRSNDSSDQSFTFVGQFQTPPDIFGTGASIAQAHYLQKPTSLGFFANTTTNVSDRLRVILGLRYSDDSVRVSGSTTEDGTADGGVLFGGVGAIVAAANEKRSSHLVSYKAGIEYDVASHILFYASTGTSTKAGVYALGPALDPAGLRYADPEKLRAYEAGFKMSFLNRRLIINPTAFYYNYKDRQSGLLFISPITGFPTGSLANIPLAHVKGAEVEVLARPTPRLTLNGTFAYLDSSIRRTLDDVDGNPLLTPVAVGSVLAQSPRYTYTLGGQYAVPLNARSKAVAQLDYSRRGKQRTTLADPLSVYGPIKQLDGRITVSIGDSLDFSAWGRNLLNSQAIVAANTSQLLSQTIYRMKPISYGVEITRRF